MLGTSARLLRLLSLLPAHREWSGAALAERLEVSMRTLRRDIDRLRSLGYPVRATAGTNGGYRLEAGAVMPPLLLDDEETVAVAVGLRTAAGGSVTGFEESSLRALAKLEQILPARLRRRVAALQTALVAMPHRGPTVDANHLAQIASACRDEERLSFAYRSHDGKTTDRKVEPYRLVYSGRRWYLVAWDVERTDWRTFRLDRGTDPSLLQNARQRGRQQLQRCKGQQHCCANERHGRDDDSLIGVCERFRNDGVRRPCNDRCKHA